MHPKTILMLLTNAYDPDPRVRQEALALIGMGCRVRLLAWDRDLKAPAAECMEGVEVERVFLSSTHEEVLYREYSQLLPGASRGPSPAARLEMAEARGAGN